MKEIAPFVYNKGVSDAEAYFRAKIEDLPATCFEPGLTYWLKKRKRRGRVWDDELMVATSASGCATLWIVTEERCDHPRLQDSQTSVEPAKRMSGQKRKYQDTRPKGDDMLGFTQFKVPDPAHEQITDRKVE
jgi:hypothetical protein